METTSGKPIVMYKRLADSSVLQVGQRAAIEPLDHPSPLVSNGKLADTSPIVRLHKGGVFETRNTIYTPALD